MQTTAIIRTIGRPTLGSSIRSCLKEKMDVIVLFDGVPVFNPIKSVHVQYVQLGRKWGHYGHIGINVGAALSKTDFITVVDDDDELISGAGDIIRESLGTKPEIDIWIPTLKFNNNAQLCFRDVGVAPGNIAVPTYRSTIFYTVPFTLELIKGRNEDYFDFFHVEKCVSLGYSIDWINKPIYSVRPSLKGTNGRGK